MLETSNLSDYQRSVMKPAQKLLRTRLRIERMKDSENVCVVKNIDTEYIILICRTLLSPSQWKFGVEHV